LTRKNKIRTSKLFILICCLPFLSNAQGILNSGQVHGSFQMDAQYYIEDSLIGAEKVPENVLMNAFANILYTNGDFSAGFRFESYQHLMKGFVGELKGNGIPYRFASYKTDELKVTIGNFYDQFGTGLIFRAYQDWNLGLDNSVDGLHLQYQLAKGITLKGLIGNQRYYFEKSDGIVRGADAEFAFNEMFPSWADNKARFTIGGSFISKFQEDDSPIYNLPENVAAFAGRMNFSCGKINFLGEYAYKMNDPSLVNNYIYKPGEALYVSTSFSQKGLGISLSGKRIDNMSFRSDRGMTGMPLMINYLPALSKQHIYTLASFYPYSTQPNGEMGMQAELTYNLKKKSALGGKYGMDISVNYSRTGAIQKSKVNDTIAIDQTGTLGYKSKFFAVGDDLYQNDFNIGISKKLSKNFQIELLYSYQIFNIWVVQGHKADDTTGANLVYANVAAADLIYKLKNKKSIQLELQHLSTKKDQGSWAMAMLQYTIAPKWTFTIQDMYNYGNEKVDDFGEKEPKIHYYTMTVAYIKNTNRFAITYGKQREGMFCAGGVCRVVPASNGISFSIMSSF